MSEILEIAWRSLVGYAADEATAIAMRLRKAAEEGVTEPINGGKAADIRRGRSRTDPK